MRRELIIAAGAAALLGGVAYFARQASASEGEAAGASALEPDWLTRTLEAVGEGDGIMKTSAAGIAAIMAREGFSAVPYADAEGFSIGYGHFIVSGEAFSSVTEADASALLVQDVGTAEEAVNSLVKVALTQGQFDALVSFVYNVGTGAFRRSTLLSKLNAGDAEGAAGQFAVWNRSGSVVLPALVARREGEREQFSA